MVDINLLPENLRDREERAKKVAAKQPHEPNFALTNPLPLKTPAGLRSPIAKPSEVNRAAQAAPPLPSATPSPAKPALPPRPLAPKPAQPSMDGTFHVAPKIGEDVARVNLLRQQPMPTPPPTGPRPAPALREDTEALLSAAVKRELAKAPAPAVPAFVSHRRGSLWGWLTGWLHRSPHPKLPTVAPQALPPLPVPPKPTAAAHHPHLAWPHLAHGHPPKTPLPPMPPVHAADLSAPGKVRHRRSFWAWLAGLFGRRHRHPVAHPAPTISLPHLSSMPPVPKPAPAKPPVTSAPASVSATAIRPSSILDHGSPVATPAPPHPAAIKTPEVPQPKTPVAPTSTPRPLVVHTSVAAPSPLRVGHEGSPIRPNVGRATRTLAINLIPTELSPTVDPRLRRRLVGLALAVVASVLTVVGLQQWVGWYEVQIGAQVKVTEDRIVELTTAIDGYERYRLEGEALQAQISTVETALSRHLYWTKIFQALEQHTIDDVHYTSFTASAEGNLTLTAIGKDYRSVARQLVAFQAAKDFAGSVTINSATAEYVPLPVEVIRERERTAQPDQPVATGELARVSFTASMTLVPEIFLMQFETQRPASPPVP